MSYRVLATEEAFWRPSNQMGVLNTDLAKQLEASTLGVRLWRLHPGQASTRHRHRRTHELYLLLEGTGRIRIGEELHMLEPLSSLMVDPGEIRRLSTTSRPISSGSSSGHHRNPRTHSR